MKLTIHRESFLAAFQQAAAVAPARSAREVLMNVLLKADGDTCHLEATDLEQAIRLPVPDTEGKGKGEALLPVLTFGAILRESHDERLALALDKHHTLQVSGKTSRFTLPTRPADEFPAIQEAPDADCHEISAWMLSAALAKTLFAHASDDSRYALNGVLLELEGGLLFAVATDGRRLAKWSGLAAGLSGVSIRDRIVPARTGKTLARLLDGMDGPLQVSLSTNSLLVRCERFTFQSRLLEGRFPRWRDVIPTEPPAADLPFTVGPLASAVRQVSIACDANDATGVTFTLADGTLTLHAASSDHGAATVELPVSYDGQKPFSTTLAYKYVLDVLRAFAAEDTLRLVLRDPAAAVAFTDGAGYTYIVMPLARD